MTETTEVSYPNVKQSWGIAGIAILLTIVLSPVSMLLNNVTGKDVSFLIYYLLSMGLTFWIVHEKRRKKTAESGYNFQLGSVKIMALLAVGVIAIQVGITAPIIDLMPMPEAVKKIFMEFAGRSTVFSFIAIVIAAPVLEELIFRGIILHGLLKKYSPVRSIVISSMLFGIVHLNPWQFVPAFIIGSLSGWVYYKTRKLTLSILIHLVNNLIAFISMYFLKDSGNLGKPVTELYGGFVNLAIIILVAVGIAGTCLYFLRLEMRKAEV